MTVKEVVPSDLELIARGLYSENRSVRERVAGEVKRLDVDRLARMLDVNGENFSLCKPFAKAFGQFVYEAKVEAEKVVAYYDAHIPALRDLRRC